VPPLQVLVLAALAAKWREPPRDALDTLVLNAANLEECDRYTQLDFTPFDPAVKFTAATVKGPDGAVFKVIKGAPQVILKKCGCASDTSVRRTCRSFAPVAVEQLVRASLCTGRYCGCTRAAAAHPLAPP
jgi:magnesium-transporting ATPase (P-type)